MGQEVRHSRAGRLLVPAALLMGLLLLLQTPWGLRTVLNMALRDTGIAIAGVRGNWAHHLQVHGMVLDSEQISISADTLDVVYDLLALVRGRIHGYRVAVVGADIVLHPSGADTTEQQAAVPVRLNDVQIYRSRFSMPVSGDSTLTVVANGVRGAALLGADPRIRVDSIDAVVYAGHSPLRVVGSAELAAGVVALDSVRVFNRRTAMLLNGRVSLPSPGRDARADLLVSAAPLAMRDIALLTGLAGADSRVVLDAAVTDEDGHYQMAARVVASGGGEVVVDAAASMPGFLDLRRIAATDFDLSLIDTGLVGVVTAELSGRLTGHSLDQMAGAWDLSVTRSTAQQLTWEDGTVRGTLKDGNADFTIAMRVNGAALAVSGTAKDMGTDPAVTLEGTLSALDLSQFGAPMPSDLDGTLQLIARGSDSVRADVHLGAGSVGLLQLDQATVAAQLLGPTLDLSLAVAAEGGSAAVSGSVAWEKGPIELSASGLLDAMDVAGALAQTVSSSISGDFEVHTRGGWPPDSGAVTLRVADSHYERHVIAGAQVRADVREADIAITGLADLAWGHFRWTVSVLPFGTTPSYDVSYLEFDRVDIGLWAEGWNTALRGTAEASGAGADRHDLTVALMPSAINAQAIDSAQVNLAMRGSTLEGAAALHMPAGGLEFGLWGAPDAASYAVSAATFHNLDLGALLGLADFRTRLSGSLDTLAVTGVQPAGLALSAGLRLDSSHINDQAVDRALLEVSADSGYYEAKADIAWDGGGVQVRRASGRWFDAVPSYDVRADAEAVDLEAVAGIPGFYSGTVALNGQGKTGSAGTTVEARVRAKASRYRELAVHEFDAAFALAEGVLQVDTIRVESNGLRLAGAGSVAVWGGADTVHTFQAGGAVLNAAPLSALFLETPVRTDRAPGDTLWVAAASRNETVSFEGHARLGGVSAGAVRILDLAAGIQGAVRVDSTGRRRLALDSLRADMQRVSIPNLSARNATAHVTLSDDTLDFRAGVAIDESRTAAFRGHADLAARQIVLEHLDMDLGAQRWQLDQASEISFGQEYRVRNFLLVAEDQEIALDGVVDPDGRQSLALTLFNVQPAPVADLLGLPGLGGTIDGDLMLVGDAAAPELDGTITMALESAGAPVGAMEAGIAYADGRLALDMTLEHTDQTRLTMQGHYPADLRLRRTGASPAVSDDVSLTAYADSFNVGWIEPFMDPALFGDAEGRLSADLRIGGTTARPALSGAVALNEGKLELPVLGITVEALQVETTFGGDSVFVHRLAADSDGGTLRGQGAIGLTDLTLGDYDLEATLDRFKVVDNEGLLAHVTGDLRLSGTTVLPELTGTVRLINADIHPTEAAGQAYEPVSFTPSDVRMLERYFNIRVAEQDTATFEFLDALGMDVSLIVGEDVWLRSRTAPEMNIPFQGVLDITKLPNEDQQVLGTVQVEPAQSYVRQFGRRFEIDTGRLTFTGPVLNPLVELRASYEVPARNNQDNPVTIFLDVTGSMLDEGELRFQLSSDPAILDESDIISYIATGRPAAEAFQMVEGNTLQVGRDIAVNQLTNLIAGAAGAELGLDIVEIEQEGSRGVTLTAGKRISRDLFASISWPIAIGTGGAAQPGASSKGNKKIIIEYSLFQWLLARLRGDTESLGASLVFQYAY